MADEWRNVALEEVADELTVGYVGPMASEYVNEGVPFLRSLNVDPLRINKNDLKFITPEFHRRIRKSRLTSGDVVIVRTGKPGACSVIPEWLDDANCSDLVIVRCGPQLNNRFLAYYVNTVASDHVAAHLVGAVQQHFNVGSARTLRLNLPPLAEQETIATALGALDDKIELNRRMNATLEAMARALFQSWFVDFDPVRTKLDGRAPTAIDPATAALFPATFQDSSLGHIPTGWEVKQLDELAERIAMGPFGSDIKVSTFVPEGIPVVSGQHLRGTLLDDSDFNFVSVEHADRLKRSNVQRGDVIFTHAGSIGQVAYIPDSSRYKRYIVSQRQFYMRCNRGLVSPYYITSYFKTAEGRHRLLANTSSTGVPSISQPVTYLRQLKIVVPPAALLKVFDATVSAIHLKIADNDHQSRTLATLRDTLLPKLLSGELSVAGTGNLIQSAS
jgi:type I restriction enzyme S subunit